MAMNTGQVIISGGQPSEVIAGNVNRTYIKIENIGSRDIFLFAGSAPTNTHQTGFPLLVGDSLATSSYIGSFWALSYVGVIGSGTSNVGSNASLSFIEED